MIRKIGLGLVALMLAAGCSGSDGSNGKDGAQGEKGDNGQDGQDGTGFDTTASVSGVFPGFALLGASIEVTLSGFATSWDETTSVSFGDGVTVSDVRVASPTALIVTVEVAGTASMGLRDVTVTTGDEALTYAQGFNLGSPIAVVVNGDMLQGSVVNATIKNMDPSRPFDDTSVPSGLFSVRYTNLELNAPAGVSVFSLDSVTPTSAEVTLFVDGDAATGVGALEVLSGPDGEQDSFPHPEAFEIKANTPEALTLNDTTDITVSANGESHYLVADIPAGVKIVEMNAVSGTADPFLVGLGAAPHLDTYIGLDPFVVGVSDAANKWYSVLWSPYGDVDYTASVTVNTIDATAIAEGASNDGKSSAVALALPGVVQGAELADDLDEDWFSITVSASDVGKSIYVGTTNGDPLTDTYITVYDPSDAVFDEVEDSGFHEQLVTGAIVDAGTYYIAISASSFGLIAGNTKYDAYAYLK
ncbi:MAG: hypothetical protein KC766_14585 [Myxococcales bacterium]|nr:hypothetical protein [Myxococcales bacterium]